MQGSGSSLRGSGFNADRACSNFSATVTDCRHESFLRKDCQTFDIIPTNIAGVPKGPLF